MCLIYTGEVFTWGDNDEGQLGDGTTNAIQRPRLVAALQGNNGKHSALGAVFLLLLIIGGNIIANMCV